MLSFIPHVPERIQINVVYKSFQRLQQNTLKGCEFFSFSVRVKKSSVLDNQLAHKISALVGIAKYYDK